VHQAASISFKPTQFEFKRFMMTIKLIMAPFALIAGLLLLGTSTAHAGRPLDVDCDLLAATNDAVNVFLDREGTQFSSVGDLFSSAILDDAVFEQLSALILLFSGGEIEFESASQGITTNGSCGLIRQLLDSVND
jgi:hypothetical protein